MDTSSGVGYGMYGKWSVFCPDNRSMCLYSVYHLELCSANSNRTIHIKTGNWRICNLLRRERCSRRAAPPRAERGNKIGLTIFKFLVVFTRVQCADALVACVSAPLGLAAARSSPSSQRYLFRFRSLSTACGFSVNPAKHKSCVVPNNYEVNCRVAPQLFHTNISLINYVLFT